MYELELEITENLFFEDTKTSIEIDFPVVVTYEYYDPDQAPKISRIEYYDVNIKDVLSCSSLWLIEEKVQEDAETKGAENIWEDIEEGEI